MTDLLEAGNYAVRKGDNVIRNMVEEYDVRCPAPITNKEALEFFVLGLEAGAARHRDRVRIALGF